LQRHHQACDNQEDDTFFSHGNISSSEAFGFILVAKVRKKTEMARKETRFLLFYMLHCLILQKKGSGWPIFSYRTTATISFTITNIVPKTFLLYCIHCIGKNNY
jgi:hypothetical protein